MTYDTEAAVCRCVDSLVVSVTRMSRADSCDAAPRLVEQKKRRREPEPPSRKPLPTHRCVRSRLTLGRRCESYTRRRYKLDVEKESKRARNVTWL